MLIRRIARPLLSAVFIGQGVETLRNPKVTLDAAQTAVTALQTLPDPVGNKIPSDPGDGRADKRGRPGRRWSVAGDRQTAPDRVGGAGVHGNTGQPWRASVLE